MLFLCCLFVLHCNSLFHGWTDEPKYQAVSFVFALALASELTLSIKHAFAFEGKYK